MVYYYRHIGSADIAARLLLQGWRLADDYDPISPAIEGAWWLMIGPCPMRNPMRNSPCIARIPDV
jgi:hypothetical protein